MFFMMNKALWDSLPGDLQNIVQEAAYAAEMSPTSFTSQTSEMLEKLRPHFKEITYPDPIVSTEDCTSIRCICKYCSKIRHR